MIVTKMTRNRARCKMCGDVIESRYTHDFQRCSCGDISIDGGTSYQRWGYPASPSSDYIEDLSEYSYTKAWPTPQC